MKASDKQPSFAGKYRVAGIDKEDVLHRKGEFLMEFDKRCAYWEDFLNERTTLISGKTTYTHRRLGTARRSVKTHLKWLFTYGEHMEVNIPNTTNMLEGYNSQIKRALLNHNGLNDTQKEIY